MREVGMRNEQSGGRVPSWRHGLVALALAAMLAGCGDDSDSGAGGGTTLSAPAAQFVKSCGQSIEKRVIARFKNLTAKTKAGMLSASNDMCQCMANRISASKRASDADKARVWAMKSFSPGAVPDLSPGGKAAFESAGQSCVKKFLATLEKVKADAARRRKEREGK